MTSELAIPAVTGGQPVPSATAPTPADVEAVQAATPNVFDAIGSPPPTLGDPQTAALALQEPTTRLQTAPPDAALPPEAQDTIARLLGVDAGEVPHLIELATGALAARGISFADVRSQAVAMGLSDVQAIAMGIALAFPQRFSAAADYVPAVPRTAEQAVLSMYVMATLMTELQGTVPEPEAMRFASVAAEKLSRLDPRDVLFVADGIPRLVHGMAGAGRIETTTAIASILHTSPETVARVVREGHDLTLMHQARALAADAHSEKLDTDHRDNQVRGGRSEAARADAVHEADLRGLAVAAAFLTLASTEAPDSARNLYARAVATAGSAAPRIVLSTAARASDGDFYRRMQTTLDELAPFLDNYDRLRAQLVNVNAVPRVELCNALHMHLTNGSEQFYMALLALLQRHTALATQSGTRALKTALRKRDNVVQAGTTTWDPIALS